MFGVPEANSETLRVYCIRRIDSILLTSSSLSSGRQITVLARLCNRLLMFSCPCVCSQYKGEIVDEKGEPKGRPGLFPMYMVQDCDPPRLAFLIPVARIRPLLDANSLELRSKC